MTGAGLEIGALGKSYDGRAVFEDLSFSLPAGGALALVGPSGCGKSSLLHILAGLDQDYRGRVEISPGRAETSLMLQDYGLFPWKTARENVELPLVLRRLGRPARARKAAALLEELGLAGCEKLYPAQLSGGQRQRLALGRALAADPDLLLLDEPFSSLDAITRESLQNLLADLWRRHGPSYVLTTHSIEEAVYLGGRILVMGGRPSRIIDIIDNPLFGEADARLEDEYFEMIKRVRLSLASAGGETP